MLTPDRVVTARFGRMIAAVVLATAVGAPAGAADRAAPRSGGLVPAPRKTREELVREWDLNSDGKIDQGEAEVAASKMRRERAEMRLNSGIDPITGRPRDEIAAETQAEEQAPEDEPEADAMPEEDPAENVDRDEEKRPTLPGTRVPRPTPSGGPPQPAGKPDLNAALKPGTDNAAAAERLRRPVAGGARAGGLPARAGYGSGLPTGPLNAGRPIPPKTRGLGTPAPAPAGPAPAGRPAATVTRPVVPPPAPAASREVYNPY